MEICLGICERKRREIFDVIRFNAIKDPVGFDINFNHKKYEWLKLYKKMKFGLVRLE